MTVALPEAKQLDREDVLRIADRFEGRLRRIFLDAVRALKGDVDVSALVEALARQDLTATEAALLVDRLRDDFGPLVQTLQEAVAEAGRTTSRALAAEIGVTLSFDIVDPRAVRWLQDHGAMLIREVTDETRRAIRNVILAAFEEGLAPREVARVLLGRTIRGTRFGGRLGLTTHQARIVQNYEAALRGAVAGDMTFGELGRRFALNPVRGPGGLVADRIDRNVRTYEERLLRFRAFNIARTEAITAASQGQQEAWQQAADQGFLPQTQLQEWRAADDERVCPICAPLDGVRVGLREPFPGGFQHPPAHPQCRCTTVLVFGQRAGVR